MATIFKNVNVDRAGILAAMRAFDEEYPEPEAYKHWRAYVVEYEGRQYPPKFLLSKASGIETSEFNGGERTNRVFRDLGFTVISTGADDLTSGVTAITEAYKRFRQDRVAMFHVRVRRRQAAYIKDLFSHPEMMDIDTFHRECWSIGELRIEGEKVELTDRNLDALEEAWADGSLEITGHHVWQPGSRVFAPNKRNGDEKLELIRQAAGWLNSDLPLTDKVTNIMSIHGFGIGVATGLVMLFYPNEFAVYNERSKAVMKTFGYPADTLEVFQASVRELKDQVGAEDYLELDHFLSLFFDNRLIIPGLNDAIPVEAEGIRKTQQPQEPSCWWVNQGQTFKSARETGSLWAPKENREGRTFKHWSDLAKLRKGDTVIHYSNGYIMALSTVQAPYKEGPRPDASPHDSWGEIGYTVPTTYRTLERPLPLSVIPSAWRKDETSGPFTTTGTVKQGYIFPLSKTFFRRLRIAFPEFFGCKIFKIAPGKAARLWDECLEHEIITIGCDDLGDLELYPDLGTLRETFASRYSGEHKDNPSALSALSKNIWDFKNLSAGDVIVANRGKSQVVGVGIVREPGYAWKDERAEHKHTVPVDWDVSYATTIPEQGSEPRTLVELEPEWFRAHIAFKERRNSWLFQANPDQWNLAEEIKKFRVGDADDWLVTRYKDEIRPGDEVLLWQSGDASGLYAIGEVTGEVFERPGSSWRTTDVATELAVPFRYTRILDAFVPRSDLLAHPVLKDMAVIRAPQGTNFRLTEVEQRALHQLLGVAGEASEDEPAGYQEPSFDVIESRISGTGMKLGRRTLQRYHLALKAGKFVVLSGISGTGKTWLTQVYAEAVGARYQVVAVAPNWTSNEDLLGYLNPMSQNYYETEFSRFLREAAAEYASRGDAARPYHLVLDEMNLARVEHYFARFLSAMELRSRTDDAVIALGNELVQLPPNLFFIGTVNIDETTHVFADKVYDRAQLIELSVDRERLAEHLLGRPYGDILLEVWDAVYPVAPFAYRVLDEIGRYVEHSEQLGVSWLEALDEQLLQKVLPKIKGAELSTREVLARFVEIASEQELRLSEAKARRMRDQYDQHGITSYF